MSFSACKHQHFSSSCNFESFFSTTFCFYLWHNKDNLNYRDPEQRLYLVFNENPPGYYPLVYQNETRQPIAEIELFDLIKNSGIGFNKDQRKWFSVDKIPI